MGRGELPSAAELARREDRAVARALTAIARAEVAPDHWAALKPAREPRRAIVWTGAPGAGKSSLIAAVVPRLRASGETVAVVACDPASPVTGGAFLGDRLRWDDLANDAGVFVRSFAQRDAVPSIDARTAQSVRLLQAIGFDWVLVETVGVGQLVSMTELAAWLCVVVVAAGIGDDAQMMKSGSLEVGDLVVATRADAPGAGVWTARLRDILSLGRGAPPEVIGASALDSSGVDELVERLRVLSAAKNVERS